VGEDCQWHRTERRGRRHLAHHDVVFAVPQRLEIAVARDRLYLVTAGPHVEPHQGRPLLGCHQRLKPLGIGVNEDEPDDLTGVGADVEPDEEAAQRVASQDIGTGDACGVKQSVEVGNGVRGGSGLGDGVTAAWADVVFEGRYRPRSIVGTNASEGGDAREDHYPRGAQLVEVFAPDPCRTAVTGFKHDRGTARTPALKVQLATVVDVDEAGEVILRGDRDRWGSAMAIEDDDGAEEDSDAATTDADSPGDLLLRKPITGSAGCCARAANGHTAAAPPMSVMNWRRLID
jgi:hypothetical protein